MSAVVRAALRKRYAAPAWALLEEVRNKTGYGGGPERYADALAMSLWPSRGLELHGFEIKASRGDWLRERDDPEKAEAISAYCDRWWLVVQSDGIVLDGELPPTWGLLVLRGKVLATVTEAAKREPKAIGRAFLASLLRRATERPTDLVPFQEVEETVKRLVEGRVEAELRARMAEVRPERMALVDQLERETGTKISEWNLPKLREAISLVSARGGSSGASGWVASLERDARTARRAADGLDALAKEARAALGAEILSAEVVAELAKGVPS